MNRLKRNFYFGAMCFFSSLAMPAACSYPAFPFQKCSIVDITNFCVESDTEKNILVADYTIYHHYETSRRLRRKLSNISVDAFVDISLPHNQSLPFLFPDIHFPALVHLLKDGTIESVQCVDCEFGEHHFYPTEPEKKYLQYAIECAEAVFTSRGVEESVIDSLKRFTPDSNSFFYNYLMCSLTEENNRSAIFRHRAINSYNTSKSSSIFLPLLLEILAKEDDTKSFIITSRDSLDLGYIHPLSTESRFIHLKNVSNIPAYIFHVNVSCSCVSVSSPSIIPPGQEDSLLITYHADETEKIIHQSIYLYTNSINDLVTIKIIGEQRK